MCVCIYIYIFIYIYIYTHTHTHTYIREKVRIRQIWENAKNQGSWVLSDGCTFFFFNYLFLAALGLCCCVRAFSSCVERRLLFIAVGGLLIAVASLVAEHRL